MLDYDYIKNCFRLIVVDLIQLKELDANSKSIQQIEFFGQLENVNSVNADGAQSVLEKIILEQIKEKRLKLSQCSVTVL